MKDHLGNKFAGLSNWQCLRIITKYVRDAQISLWCLGVPVLLALAASLFEAGSLALLIPIFTTVLSGAERAGDMLPEPIRRAMPAVLNGSTATAIITLAATAFLAVVLKTAFRYAATISLCKIVRTFATALRKRVYARFLSFGKLFFDKNDSGQLHSILTYHVGAVANGMMGLQDSLYALFTLLAYTGLMVFISWRLTIVILVVFPVLHYALRALISKIERTSYAHVDAINRLGRKIAGSLAGMSLVRAYNNEEEEQNRFAHVSDVVEAFVFSMQKKSLLISPLQEVITLSFLLLVILLMSYVAQTTESSSVAEYAVFLFVLRRAAATFGVVNSIKGSLAGMKGPVLQLEGVFDDTDKFFVGEGQLHFQGLQGAIRLEQLSYLYPDGLQALQDVTLEIRKGCKTAIVGSSGAGKTTLINLIMRFYDPPAGGILVDGVDVREFTLASWHKHIALVSQDTFLFNDTLKNNLLYGLRRVVPEEEINAVVEQACLAGLLSTLPKGLDTEVGERGVKLSGGEKQRVAIARALLKRADILVLDEATSALDSVTERTVRDALNRLTDGKTAIIVAHRLATVRDADVVAVVEGGKVVELGSPRALIAQDGRFAEFWREQKMPF